MDFFGNSRKQLQRLWNICRSGKGQVWFQSRFFSSPAHGRFPPLWMASTRAFPPLLKEDDRPHALLATGGILTEESLLKAYSKGIYPVFLNHQLKWIVFNPRSVLFLEKTKLQKKVKKLIRKQHFRVTFDTAFEEVVRECSKRKWTWLVPERIRVAISLHKRGQAHSVEVWNGDGKLVGGAYGTDMGRIFIEESVFHHESFAGNVADAYLYCHLQHWGYRMVDAQAYNEHDGRMGFEEISADEYVRWIKMPSDTDTRQNRWMANEHLNVAGWIPSLPEGQGKEFASKNQAET